MGFLSAWRVSARNRRRAYDHGGVRYDQPSPPAAPSWQSDVVRLHHDVKTLWDELQSQRAQYQTDLKAIHGALSQQTGHGVNPSRNLALQLALGAFAHEHGKRNPAEVVDMAGRFYAFLQGDA